MTISGPDTQSRVIYDSVGNRVKINRSKTDRYETATVTDRVKSSSVSDRVVSSHSVGGRLDIAA